MQYTFGTSNTAACRLAEMAKFFNPPAVEFIQKYNHDGFNSGIDIGCGPGYTTQMLATAIKSNNVCGLDISDNFLSLAGQNYPRYGFKKHDITQFPFPLTAQTAYARFVLSHLTDPVSLINKWTNELESGGLIFIEEVEAIDTQTKAFKEYLNINSELVGSQGAELFVGNIIACGRYAFRVLCNERIRIPVSEWQAASWFHPNTISIWENNDFLKRRFSENERREISDSLLEIKETGKDDGDTFWFMRRIVMSKKIPV